MAGLKRIDVLVLALLIAGVMGCAQKPVKRIGRVIELREEMIPEYKALHADGYAGVRDLLSKYQLDNFSVFLHKIDGKWYEFAYYEYTGDDFDADRAGISAEPRNIEWLKLCDPMQIPLDGNKSWTTMETIFYNE